MIKQKNIYVVGVGAIGKVLAVFLKLKGKNVTLLRGSVDDQPGYHRKFSVELNDGTKFESEIEVSTISSSTTLDGIIVLTNKSFGNLHLSDKLKNKINNSPIVILQNGLDVEQPFIENNFTQIYRCVLFATSQPVSENKMKFKPVAVSPIGIINGNTENLLEIIEQLNSTNFQFKAEQDIQPIIWTKTIVNSVFNSVCPLLEVDNGIFNRNKTAHNIAKRIISECVSIAKLKGISIKEEAVMDSLLMISKFSDGQLISTYQDILNKRKTEIDTLNFAIVRIAKELGQENAVMETKILGELTRLKSELNQ